MFVKVATPERMHQLSEVHPVKTIAVLDHTLPMINLLVLFVIKDNGKIKVVNRAVKYVVVEPTTIHLDEKPRVKIVVLERTHRQVEANHAKMIAAQLLLLRLIKQTVFQIHNV